MQDKVKGIVAIALCSVATSCSRSEGPERPNTTDVVAPGTALGADLEVLRANTRDHLLEVGAPFEELEANLDMVTEAALEGDYDVDAFDAILDSLAGSSEEAEKASLVLYLYADSVMAGYRLDVSDQDPGVALGTLALCNTCTTPAALAAPGAACQFISGNTTAACVSDFYTVNLPANSSCTFTMCTATCAGASFGYDSRIRIRTPGTCAINVDNDDSCGLGSLATFNTGAAAQTKIIEVTGFTTGNFGNYNMGYRCTPIAASCPFTGTLGVAQAAQPNSSGPKRTWSVLNRLFRNGVASTCAGKACPGTNATAFMVPHDAWDFPADPAARCITVSTSNIGCTQIHPQSYRGLFPTGASTGNSCPAPAGVVYAGDSGASDLPGGTPVTYSFNVPANTPWSTVFVNPINATANCSYSFTVSPCNTAPPPPSCRPTITSITPTSGSTTATSCGRAENFTVNFSNASWTAPSTVTLTIAPPAGGSASPTVLTRTLTSPVASTTFGPVSLNRANCPASGNFALSATATNVCVPAQPNSTATGIYSLLDTTPPAFGPRNDICMWPPNHEALCQDSLDLRAVTDNCGSTGIVMGAESCVSDQPDDGLGDGDTSGDCVIGIDDVGGQQTVCTRSERSGTDPTGRVYTVSGRARDACGNFTPSTILQVNSVPHDQSEHPECIAP